MAKARWGIGATALVALGGLVAARAALRQLTKESVRGKTVVIMGGSRGLGLDLARLFAAKGCRVAFCARDPEEVARAARDVAAHAPQGAVLAAVCDASNEEAVGRFVSDVQARFGVIDILVTCAATIQVGPAEVMSKADYEESMTQIFWTAYIPTMAVLPEMRANRRGDIVHVTSFGGKVPAPHLLPYSTAKFAATGFSSGLRSELAKDGVRVTTIAPGLLRTGAHANVPFKGQQEKEYAWFAFGATMPFVSLSSEAAARRIVAAIEHGDAEPVMSVGTRLATIFAAVAPGLTSRLLAMANARLPSANGGSLTAKRGTDVAAHASSKVVRALDAYGAPNAARHNEYPGPINVAGKALPSGT